MGNKGKSENHDKALWVDDETPWARRSLLGHDRKGMVVALSSTRWSLCPQPDSVVNGKSLSTSKALYPRGDRQRSKADQRRHVCPSSAGSDGNTRGGDIAYDRVG